MESKVRNSNIELLRILCMFFIILHHSFCHSGINYNLNNLNYNILFGLQFLAKVANNIFILITGYYMLDKEINKKSIKKIIFKTFFYSYSILLIYILVTRKIDFNIIKDSIIPLTINNNWFVISYILLYMSIPIINILISNLSKKQYDRTLLGLIICLSILPTIGVLDQFFSIYVWFICLYMIGAYIKKYRFNETLKKDNNNLLVTSCIGFYAFIALMKIFNLELGNFGEMNSFIISIMSITTFVLFINKQQWCNSAVNYISSSVLGVYLVHDNFIVRKHIWKLFKINEYITHKHFFLYEIVIVLVIFGFCLLIDKLLEKLLFKHLFNKTNTNHKKEKEYIKV